MARGNRDSAVRGYRSTLNLGNRRGVEREVERPVSDRMKILHLVYQGVSLVVRYHEGDETEEAFDALRLGAQSLGEQADRLGLSDRAITDLVLDPIEGEVGLMYDIQTAERLVQALRLCFDKPLPRVPMVAGPRV